MSSSSLSTASVGTSTSDAPTKKPVRVWVDMCADLFHYGHANALRQAKELGDVLVVGIHPDAEVEAAKGPPVMNEQERLSIIQACKWVDEVTLDAPYTTTLATLEKFNIDFCVHGDDISVGADGKDSYEEVKKAGKFKVVKRTEGVSTTDIVGRMILATKSHFDPDPSDNSEDNLSTMESAKKQRLRLASTRTIHQFTDGRVPLPTDKVVYIDGAFDLFHMGHVNALRQARELGDFLIVGIHSDLEVNKRRGQNFPIMNLHERTLSVLCCKYVDEVIIGAPYKITKDMIESLGIHLVVHGDDTPILMEGEEDPFKVPKEMGLYTEIKSTPGLTTADIVRRVFMNVAKYQERNTKKAKKELMASGKSS